MTPVLITVLANVGGVLVVGVGGGIVRPMQQRWERQLISAEQQVSSSTPAPTASEAPPADGRSRREF